MRKYVNSKRTVGDKNESLLITRIHHNFNSPNSLSIYHSLKKKYPNYVLHKSRYGFIHDQKIPSPEDDKKTLEKKLEVLAQREKKWVKMLSKWDSKSTKEKLHKRIYKGIPEKVRTHVWTKLLNLADIMSNNENKNKYHEMLELARLHSTEARQIDSDVNRQFRENIFFRERYNQRQRSLFNVLVAYSMYNMEVMC